MKVLNGKVRVELVEDKGVVQMLPEHYAVVKVLSVPPMEHDDVNAPYVTVGSKVLTTHLEDYLIDDKKRYYTNLKHIVEVL